MKSATYKVTLTALLSFLSAAIPAYAQQTPRSTAQSSEPSLQFSMAQGADVFDALYVLAENAPTLIDVEVVRRHDQQVMRIVPFFSIPAKTYTIPELLMLFQTAIPGMTWSRDEREYRQYHIKIVLDPAVDNSLDYLVPEGVTMTEDGIGWIDWLNKENPHSGMVCNILGLSFGSGPVGAENISVTLTIPNGMTYRDVLSQISEACRTNWAADIEDEDVAVSENPSCFYENPHVRHGSTHMFAWQFDASINHAYAESFVPHPSPGHFFGAQDHDYAYRTAVDFNSRFWKTDHPGITIAPVAPDTIKKAHVSLPSDR